MSKILELREKRANAWDAAKAFLDTKRGGDGLLSPEDTAVYEKMEADVVALGKEIERLERQAAIDLSFPGPQHPHHQRAGQGARQRPAAHPPSTESVLESHAQ